MVVFKFDKISMFLRQLEKANISPYKMFTMCIGTSDVHVLTFTCWKLHATEVVVVPTGGTGLTGQMTLIR